MRIVKKAATATILNKDRNECHLQNVGNVRFCKTTDKFKLNTSLCCD